MLRKHIITPLWIAAALLVAATSAGHAANLTADCTTNPGGSSSNLSALTIQSGDFVTVKGTCYGVTINSNGVTLVADGTLGGTILGQVSIVGTGATLIGLTIDGSLSSGSTTDGVVVQPGASASLYNCVIKNWSGRGINVDMNAAVGVSGGSIKFGTGQASAGGAGIAVKHGGTAAIGFAPPSFTEALGSALPVEISNNQGYGLDIENNGQVEIHGANIHDNGGSEIYALFSNVNIQGGTISAPTVNGPNAIQLVHTSMFLTNSVAVTGAGAYTIAGWAGSMIAMRGATVTQTAGATHTALQVADGSTAASLGGNTISASGGTAITVANASTFHEQTGQAFGYTALADTITGLGAVQVQSNMELGTGGSSPSTWTGSIAVQQNSSFRMDGGMTITGSGAGVVQLSQASNAFFNLSNGGKNVATGGVVCSGTAAGASSHVAAPANVVTAINGSTSAVTIGATPPACLGF